MDSRFSKVEEGAPIDAFVTIKAYLEDTHPNKLNLVIGGFRTEDGNPWILPEVRVVQTALANEDSDKECAPSLGRDGFRKAAATLVLGKNSPAILENRTLSIQTLSGSGALRLGAEFLSKLLGYKTFFCSIPTYRNHKLLFHNAGFQDEREYRYWSSGRSIDIDGLLEDLWEAPENSVVILQPCVHNPSGFDPSREQWAQIADVVEKRKLFPFFDLAFQGFASGDLDEDVWVIRYFVGRGIELLCSQSFSKNFGLYNERIGNLIMVVKDPIVIPHIASQFEYLIHGLYFSPPSHGARIVEQILEEPDLFQQWKGRVKTMRARINKTRKALRIALEKLKTPGDWRYLTEQIGITTSSSLTEKQVEHMAKKHHIYLLSSGNFSICAINSGNIDRFAQAIHETVKNVDDLC